MEFLRKLVLSLSIALSIGLVCLTTVVWLGSNGKYGNWLGILVFVVVFLLASILICICVHSLKELKRIAVKNEILNMQVAQESTMYQKVSEVYEQARTINHDVKSYLVAVLGLLENAEYEEARTRIVDIVDRRLNSQMVYYASSGAINAVLNDKLETAAKQNSPVDIRINGVVPPACTMETAVILANLLDNAIEAEEKEDNREITLDMYEEKGMYCILVQNCISVPILTDNPKLHTTKEDKFKHGLGIRSVRRLARDLDGVLLLSEQDGKFCAYVSFPMKKG